MPEIISRSHIFNRSFFVDNQIAFEQQSIYGSINQDDQDEMAYMQPLLDHLVAFRQSTSPLTEFCVLAYDAVNKADYDGNFSRLMADFFNRLNIEDLFLLTTINTNWNDYIFENNEKKNRIIKMMSNHTDGTGILLSVKELPEILPLFLHTHPDYPHINIMPAEDKVALNMFLCKDGNFHTLFHKSLQHELQIAAGDCGLQMGSFELCHSIKNNL